MTTIVYTSMFYYDLFMLIYNIYIIYCMFIICILGNCIKVYVTHWHWEIYSLIEVLRSITNHVINDIDHYHQLWYDEALNLPTILNVEEKMPRIPQVSIHCDNPPAESPCLYYKYLHNLLTQLDERFKESRKP